MKLTKEQDAPFLMGLKGVAMKKTEPSEAAGLGKTAALAALELLAAKPGLIDSIGDIAEAMHAFAKRAVEAEREACAEICDELCLRVQGGDKYLSDYQCAQEEAYDTAATAIRERGAK